MNAEFAIVDLFAGPGGLAEGFSAYETAEKVRPFSVRLSVEKDESAHDTLSLRAFLRQFGACFPPEYYDWLNNGGAEPEWQSLYPAQWKAAREEALCLTLGDESAGRIISQRIQNIRKTHGRNTVLIGGPPCQAYSLVGRARNRGIADYDAAQDHRHFLYREYIRIISQLEPAAFVMENVKGMLSSTVDGVRMFDLITADLQTPPGTEGYELFAFAAKGSGFLAKGQKPADFVVRAEELGVPQARHRVIIIGLRRDIANELECANQRLERPVQPKATVEHVLDGMARLRSGISRGLDSQDAWREAIEQACHKLAKLETGLPPDANTAFLDNLAATRAMAGDSAALGRRANTPNGIGKACPLALADWLKDDRLHVLPDHETRGHMPADLARYLFAAAWAASTGQSPTASSFPAALAPDHRSWASGKFADRFRVQLPGQPSTTVTSHISKDGHYFIHPDPSQCRSLTVREAARLQTFPDNYVFRGNRTQRFVQVGNAVPPFLARQIAETLWGVLANSGTDIGAPTKAPASIKEIA
jgi:DNA (cytosine-5)-methyltransferase 1